MWINVAPEQCQHYPRTRPFFRDRDIKQYWMTARVCEIRLDGFVLLRLLHGTTNTAEPAVVAIIIGFRAIVTNKVRNMLH